MEVNERRQFLKQATLVAVAAGPLAATAAVQAKETKPPAAKPVLYRETADWTRYYDSLR